jgi:hypothetical protein
MLERRLTFLLPRARPRRRIERRDKPEGEKGHNEDDPFHVRIPIIRSPHRFLGEGHGRNAGKEGRSQMCVWQNPSSHSGEVSSKYYAKLDVAYFVCHQDIRHDIQTGSRTHYGTFHKKRSFFRTGQLKWALGPTRRGRLYFLRSQVFDNKFSSDLS